MTNCLKTAYGRRPRFLVRLIKVIRVERIAGFLTAQVILTMENYKY